MNKDFSIRDYSMVFSLIGVWLIFFFLDSSFIGADNLTNLAIEFSIIATLSLGVLLIILPGEIDLSVGSGVGMTGGLACVLVISFKFPAVAAMAITVLCSVLLWYGMGKLITSHKLPSFITTLGGLLIFKGIFLRITESKTVPVSKGGEENLLSILTTYKFSTLSSFLIFGVVALLLYMAMLKRRKTEKENGFEPEDFERSFLKVFVVIQALLLLTVTLTRSKGVPLSLLILGTVAMIIFIITKHTAFGRYLYAIGGNKEAAEISGINVNKVVCKAFVILGGIVALTGFMQVSYGGYSTATAGELMELDAIAACVIGGVSLSGGKGSVGGVLIGALLMTSLINGMNLLTVEAPDKFIVRGAVLVAAVWLDVYFSRKKA